MTQSLDTAERGTNGPRDGGAGVVTGAREPCTNGPPDGGAGVTGEREPGTPPNGPACREVVPPFGRLVDLVAAGNVVILSGAGLSTESGIPDYRGPSGLARRAEPMTYQTFTATAAARQRYWARSHLGWRHVARAAPNAGHRAVADLQRGGLLAGIITQNVDGLHQAAGASGVIELHGSLSRVLCLGCGERTPRRRLDERLRDANPGWAARAAHVTPDGDAILADDEVTGFAVAGCESCGGVLKPDVVFFGENVPRPRVDECFRLVERASALIVLGSSLSVMSGYRFARQAAKLDIPVVIINQGATRGDAHALMTIDARLGATLGALVSRIFPEPVTPA